MVFHRTNGDALGGRYPWVTADLPGRIHPNAEVQRALDGGGVVLRVGDGSDKEGTKR